MRHLLKRRTCDSGIALVIVLCFVALLSGLIVAAMVRSSAGTKLSDSSLSASKADHLALSAIDIVIGGLKQEMVNGSTVTTVSGVPVYAPSTAAAVLPARFGNPLGSPDPVPNLIRVSSRLDAGVASPMVSSQASALSSTNVSLNGRSIALAQWNRHYLLPRDPGLYGGKPTKAGTDPISAFRPPDWVFVTSGGPKALSAPSSSAIGRFAYAVYDEGGLLDLNVAGTPTGLTAVQGGRKGGAAFADLVQIGLTQPQIDKLVGWRNYATAQPSGTLASGFSFNAAAATRYVDGISTNGVAFTQVSTNLWQGRTDQMFVSRQALIQFFLSNGFSLDALQYAAVGNASWNAPGWMPAYDASSLGGNAANAYKSNANLATSVNRFLPNARFPSKATLTTYALDGTLSTRTVEAGSPVIQQRFCLGRMGWITWQGPNPAVPNAAAAIQRHFGLVWDDTQKVWIYTSPDGSAGSPATTLKTLDQVAAAGREPDFFELLQAVILSGSIGKDGGPVGGATTGGTSGNTQSYDSTAAYQVLQIGANILDEARPDRCPIDIQTSIGPLAPIDIYGVEDLPYLPRVFFCVYRYGSDPTQAGGWYTPEIWNPYQSATATGPSPAKFRFVATGSAQVSVSGTATVPITVSGPITDLAPNPGVEFTLNPTEPTLLMQSNATSSEPRNMTTSASINDLNGPTPVSVTGRPIIGIWGGDVASPTQYNTSAPATQRYNRGVIQPVGSVNFFLQYWHPNFNKWMTYSVMKKQANASRGGSIVDITTPATQYNWFFYVQRSDPRTDRFGGSQGYQTYNTTGGVINRTIRATWGLASGDILDVWAPVTTAPTSFAYVYPANPSVGSFQNNGNINVQGMFEENRITSTAGVGRNAYYPDPDGIVRRANGAFAQVNINDGLPLLTGNTASRPVMLHRPFRSVGELGYCFRDLPWKDVDFFTPESGDAGFLDAFSVEDGLIVEGRVNLNTRQPLVLQALLSGALKSESATTTVATGEASSLAASLRAVTSATPLFNRADLVSRFTSSLETDTRFPAATYPRLALSTASDNRIAAQRTAIVRALADAADTRTWNLLIDVIAQNGKFPKTATSLDQFVVDGQRHYWLHIALDRHTGQVVSRSLEPVNE